MKWLLFGGKGWIGSYVTDLLHEEESNVVIQAISRADNEIDVEKEISVIKPDRIVSLVGRTYGEGFTTIDYLEQKGKLVENLRDNLYGPIVLANLASRYGIHLTYLGTGCIFAGTNDGKGFSETDLPNFTGSSYSTAKGFTDRIMHQKPYCDHVLNVRIRMPITADDSPRNFITKILKYEKICSIPNSMTVLPELLPFMIDMAKNKSVGTINLTNPGLISHNEILEMVREIINPNLQWCNFSLEEQDKILLSGRSNNLLCTDKLHNLYPQVLPIKESVRNVVIAMKNISSVTQEIEIKMSSL